MELGFALILGLAITGEPGFHRPVVSADGALVAFTIECGGRHEAAVAHLDGSGFRRLTTNDVEDWYPHFSPNGGRVVFFRGGEVDGVSRYDIVSLELTTGLETVLSRTGAYEGDPAFTPDGLRIVFNSNRTGNHEVWIMNGDGSNQKRLTDNPLPDFSPKVRPGGRRIVYVAKDQEGYGLMLMDLDGQARHPLDVGRRENYKPEWAPDGRSLAFFGPVPSDRTGEPDLEIFRYDLEERRLTRLTNARGGDGDPYWTPDGKRILFSTDRRGRDELYVMEADGSGQRLLFDDSALVALTARCSGW